MSKAKEIAAKVAAHVEHVGNMNGQRWLVPATDLEPIVESVLGSKGDPAPVEPNGDPRVPTKPAAKHTAAQLNALAKANEVQVPSNSNKAKLIEVLEANGVDFPVES